MGCIYATRRSCFQEPENNSIFENVELFLTFEASWLSCVCPTREVSIVKNKRTEFGSSRFPNCRTALKWKNETRLCTRRSSLPRIIIRSNTWKRWTFLRCIWFLDPSPLINCTQELDRLHQGELRFEVARDRTRRARWSLEISLPFDTHENHSTIVLQATKHQVGLQTSITLVHVRNKYTLWNTRVKTSRSTRTWQNRVTRRP